MKENRKCAICGASFGKILLTIRRPDRFERAAGVPEVRYRRWWRECSGCGAATDIHDAAHRKLLKELETAYYAVDFASSSLAGKYKKVMALPAKKSDNAQRVLRIHAFMEDWLKRYFPQGKGPFRVLDIGAGLGVFLARFLEGARADWEATAVESDPLACRHLASLKKFRVVEETFPGRTQLKDFDLVTLNKVVEHIKNPVSFLKKIRAALSPRRGILYIELPDKLTIGRRPPTDNILGALHHHLYDLRSIEALLKNSGFFTIQAMRFFEPSGKITVAAFAALPKAVEGLMRRSVT